MQTRLEVAVGALLWNWVDRHAVVLRHTRSVEGVGALLWYVTLPLSEPEVQFAHTRSVEPDGTACSYWPAMHTVKFTRAKGGEQGEMERPETINTTTQKTERH